MTQEYSQERLPYPPALTGRLSDMEEEIKISLALNKPHATGTGTEDIVAEVVEDAAFEVWQEGTIHSLDQFEACLRNIGSQVYCIAEPASQYEGYRAVGNPADDNAAVKYVLAVADGETEAGFMLDNMGIDAAENRARLAQAGLPLGFL